MADESPVSHNDPRSSYQEHQINGFTVLVSQRLLEHAADAVADIGQMTLQLGNIVRVVPDKPLAVLKNVTIWLEWAEEAGLGEFHWGPEYLIQMGRNPEKAHCVEIVNARHMLEWAGIQPWSLLHELAHAYHCLSLTFDHPGVTNAYNHAIYTNTYNSVAYVSGGKQKAYATNNKQEFFAELTEAYFGKNDFQPYNKEELQSFDPVGYQLMLDVWGIPTASA